MSENGEIYTAGKNFTLPPALTALTNSTSALSCPGQLITPKHWVGHQTSGALICPDLSKSYVSYYNIKTREQINIAWQCGKRYAHLDIVQDWATLHSRLEEKGCGDSSIKDEANHHKNRQHPAL